jgi:transposase-like protein
MADTVGVSKSSVSRAAIQASEAQLDRLLNRRFDDVDLLIIYIDGMHFGDQCVIGAVGVDEHGQKHVLGLQEGATENSAAAKDLLEDLVRRGVKPERRRLFVIDGSKALRAAINAVFGSASLVQRCRQHKLRNVTERLPKGPAGADQIADASGMETRRQRRNYETGKVGEVAGERAPGRGRQPAGRDG